MDELGVASIGHLARVDDFRGAVHAVFVSSVYLEPASGPMIVIHHSAHGHTPSSCHVDNARPIAWGLRVGDRVAGRLGRLRVGDVMFDARHARVWHPPQPASLTAARFASLPYSPREAAVADEATDADAQRLSFRCNVLATAFAIGSERDAALASRALVGRGPGLTPSGDDAIVGLLAVVHRACFDASMAEVAALARSVVTPLLDRTTPISAHYLRLALDGHMGEHLTALADACLRGRFVDRALLACVRNTGATSGRDALVGVAAGLSLVARTSSSYALEGAA